MLFILEVPCRIKDGLVSARLEKRPHGWCVHLVFHDGRTFYSEDKLATDELDGLMMDADYFLAGFLKQSGEGQRFSCVESRLISAKEEEKR